MLTGNPPQQNRARFAAISFALFAACLVALSGCGSQQAAAPTAVAPIRDAPASSQQSAFLDGYQAYTRHDLSRAIQQLGKAADSDPGLGDYALFYLARAAREAGDQNTADRAANRLIESYPQSILAPRAQVELAELSLQQGRPEKARDLSQRALAKAEEGDTQREAYLTSSKALIALGDARGAYQELQALRHKYPHSQADAQARELVAGLLVSHPGLVEPSFSFYREEAELLLEEGQRSEALTRIDSALAEAHSTSARAELLWLKARALHSEPSRAQQTLKQYLAVAPDGPSAPEALFELARIYWHQDDTQGARSYFERTVREFSSSKVAPQAMLSIGHTFEDDKAPADARAEYLRLVARYPASDAADEARFRAPWLLYSAGDFRAAAASFAEAGRSATTPAERDRLAYWHARALEKSGDSAAARPIFEQVALSTDTNYYPALASRRLTAAVQPSLPAAGASLPAGAPPQLAGDAQFHIVRVTALGAIGLASLEVGELKALRAEADRSSELRYFLLSEFQHADDYRDAISLAGRLAERGELSPAVAERVRYPRAYWDLIAPAAARNSLDPYLVESLTRQESLFDPDARSASDARGLMQLLPSTAERVALGRDGFAASHKLYDPALNIDLGIAYLGQLMAMFGRDQFKAVAAYNAGEHAVEKWNRKFSGDDDEWVENIDYRETRDYVKKVLGGLREYQLLYGSNPSLT